MDHPLISALPPAPARAGTAPPPLQGIRVADFTRFLSGPYCTQILADLGAEVIKIEDPKGGDGTRAFTPPEIDGQSPYFLGFNRNKQSIALDLRAPGDLEIARRIVQSADIVVENFIPGTMARFGLDHATLAAGHPGLICCSICGYNSDTDWGGRPGFDAVFQSECGFASLNGEPDRDPMRAAAPVVDMNAALQAVIAILAALQARHRDGLGQQLEVSLFETTFQMLGYFPFNYLASGQQPQRSGNTSPISTPLGLFHTQAGNPIYISCSTQKAWLDLCHQVLDRPDLAQDSDFATIAGRNAHQSRLMGILADCFRAADTAHWMARLTRAMVPAGELRSLGDALGGAAAQAHQIVTRIPLGEGHASQMPVLKSPLRFGRTPVAYPKAPPRLDADRAAILARLI